MKQPSIKLFGFLRQNHISLNRTKSILTGGVGWFEKKYERITKIDQVAPYRTWNDFITNVSSLSKVAVKNNVSKNRQWSTAFWGL
jgi:hypothetical protein